MESWIRRVLLTASSTCIAACLASAPAWAEPRLTTAQDPELEPRILRTNLDEDEIDSENFAVGAYMGHLGTEDFGTNEVFGATLAYHATEDLFFEAAIGESDTQFPLLEPDDPAYDLALAKGRELRYYNLSLGWNVLPGEVFLGRNHAYNMSFYVIGGAGSTDFLGQKQFTYNAGAGLRLLVNDWLALHLDAREYTFENNALGFDRVYNQLEMRTGLSAFF